MNKYIQSTDEIYTLFESFKLSGFNEDQALKLTEVYCRQSVLENILLDEKRRISKREVINRYGDLTTKRKNNLKMMLNMEDNNGNC